MSCRAVPCANYYWNYIWCKASRFRQKNWPRTPPLIHTWCNEKQTTHNHCAKYAEWPECWTLSSQFHSHVDCECYLTIFGKRLALAIAFMGNATLELLPPIRCETRSTAKLSDIPLIWIRPVHSVWKQSTPLNVSEPLNFLSKQIGANALPQHNTINTCHKSPVTIETLTSLLQCYTVPFSGKWTFSIWWTFFGQ